MATQPPEKAADRNSSTSSSGDGTRRSRRTKAKSSATEPATQPQRGWRCRTPDADLGTASSSRVRAGISSRAPRPSKSRSALVLAVTGTTSQPIAAAASENGTLTQNSQRQSKASSSRPPRAGPALTPIAWAAAKMPMARAFRAGPRRRPG